MICVNNIDLKEWLGEEMWRKGKSIIFFSSYDTRNPAIESSVFNIAVYCSSYSTGIYVYTFQNNGTILCTIIWNS